MSSYAASFEDVLSAHERIAGRVHRTPVLTCSTLNEMSGRSLFFKCENMQRVGAFKFRGATNAVLVGIGGNPGGGAFTVIRRSDGCGHAKPNWISHDPELAAGLSLSLLL